MTTTTNTLTHPFAVHGLVLVYTPTTPISPIAIINNNRTKYDSYSYGRAIDQSTMSREGQEEGVPGGGAPEASKNPKADPPTNSNYTLCLVMAMEESSSGDVTASQSKNRGPQAQAQQRVILHLPPDTTTIADLHRMAAQHHPSTAAAAAASYIEQQPNRDNAIPTRKKRKTTTARKTKASTVPTASASVVRLSVWNPNGPAGAGAGTSASNRVCFLDASSGQTLSETTGIHHQDRILVSTVTAAASSSNDADSLSPNCQSVAVPSIPTTPQSSSSPRLSRRSAAAAALTRIAAAATSSSLSTEPSIPGATQKKKKHAPSPRATQSSHRHFVALEKKQSACTSSSPQQQRKQPNGSGGGGGRRLHDGAVVPVRTQRKNPSTQMAPQKPFTTDDALEGLIAGTVADQTSAQGQLMRRGWRQAVQSAYEQNQAASRVAAAQSYLIVTKDSNKRSGNTTKRIAFDIVVRNGGTEEEAIDNEDSLHQQKQLRVTYPKGVQGRGNWTDTVDYLPINVLKATIAAIHPSEALRASNLSLLSPRVFWSLLYHHNNSHPQSSVGGMDVRNLKNGGDQDVVSSGDAVQDALVWACPDLDWSFLRRRPVQLSAKAFENLRQQQDKDSPATDWEAAASAIAAVEQAMEDLPSAFSANERSLPGNVGSDGDCGHAVNWRVKTPTEEDIDELKDCIVPYDPHSYPNPELSKFDSFDLADVTDFLCHDLSIRNWRELANVDDACYVFMRLRYLLRKQEERRIVRDLVQGIDYASSYHDVAVSLMAVSSWIDYAQLQSLDEIMVEICDGDTEAVETLRDEANSGTPKDLALWQSIPGLLRERFPKSDGPTVKTQPDITTIQVWCDRARKAVEQLEWLDLYTTPLG